MLSRRQILPAALALLACDATLAADPAKTIESAFRERMPDVRIQTVRPSAIPGLYEVYTGTELVYTDATGDRLIMGPMLDTRTRTNLTTESIDRINAIDFSRLPLEQAIKTVKGDGRRVLVVFSDPDCPFCKELETELDAISDVTIYTFLYPLAELHPEAPARARQLWCAADRAAAWAQWMHQRKAPEARDCDASVVDRNVQLGDELRIAATPTLFTGTGRRLSGLHKAAEIHRALESREP